MTHVICKTCGQTFSLDSQHECLGLSVVWNNVVTAPPEPVRVNSTCLFSVYRDNDGTLIYWRAHPNGGMFRIIREQMLAELEKLE